MQCRTKLILLIVLFKFLFFQTNLTAVTFFFVTFSVDTQWGFCEDIFDKSTFGNRKLIGIIDLFSPNFRGWGGGGRAVSN